MPQFMIMRLANDGTGAAAGVADNDRALGMIVEGVSKSKFWGDTAIFVVEASAPAGASPQSPALVISPWVKKGQTVMTMYNQTSVLRTIELILGLKPLTVYDAGATPMFDAFAEKPTAGEFVSVNWGVSAARTRAGRRPGGAEQVRPCGLSGVQVQSGAPKQR